MRDRMHDWRREGAAGLAWGYVAGTALPGPSLGVLDSGRVELEQRRKGGAIGPAKP